MAKKGRCSTSGSCSLGLLQRARRPAIKYADFLELSTEQEGTLERALTVCDKLVRVNEGIK